MSGLESVSATRAAAVAACGDENRVIVDPVSRTIAGFDAMRVVRTWDAHSGRCLLLHAFDRRHAIAIAFDRTGDRLAVLLAEGTLVVFERREQADRAWFVPMHSYPGPVEDEYLTKLAFDAGDSRVIVTGAPDVSGVAAVRVVEVSPAGFAGYANATAVAQPEAVEATQTAQPIRVRVDIAGGGSIIVVRNAGARTGRMSGPGMIAFWNDIGIDRFELDFNGNQIRFAAVRNDAPWTLLGTSTVDALGRDGWYALAAALGVCYDGKITAFERDLPH